MPSIARNETSSCSNPKLDIFLRKSGVAVDVDVLEFQIFDVSTPAKQITPVQVYPLVIGTRQLVNQAACPVGQHIATGRYAALWTVPMAEELGAHEIRWFFQEITGGPEQTFSEEFDVTAVVGAGTDELYITVGDIRALGIDATMISDDDLEALIATCQEILERACRQWFAPRLLQFKFDGSDSDAAHFGIPIIMLEWLKLNNDTAELDPSYYRVYSAKAYPDDRRNPRIKLVRDDANASIYTAPNATGILKFRKGRQNQEVRGTFGFVEEDGSTPKAIVRALTKLVVEKITHPIFVAPGASPPPAPPPGAGGIVVEEQADDHRIKFSAPTFTDRRSGLSGITQDQEVLDIIKLYRAPIGVATPAHWSY
jgi:hypothetical protein